MKQNDIISIIQDNDISEYYSLKNLGIEGYAFPYQEALKIVQTCKLLWQYRRIGTTVAHESVPS